MFRCFCSVIVLACLIGCGDSTGPSDAYRSQVAVISTSSHSVTSTFDLGDVGCEKLVLSPDGSSLYVSSYYSKEIAQLSSSTGAITGLMTCSNFDPTDLALNGSGAELYVLSHNDLYVVSTASMKVIDFIDLGLGHSWAMKMRPGTDLLYVQRDGDFFQGTLVVDVVQRVISDTLDVNTSETGCLFFSLDGSELYAGRAMEVLRIDPDNGQQTASVTLPGSFGRLCIDSRSGIIYATWNKGLEVSDGWVSIINPNSFSIQQSIDLPYCAYHVCCVESMDYLYVVSSENHCIQILDLNLFQVVGEIEVDQYVRGFALSPDGELVYCPVYNLDSGAG